MSAGSGAAGIGRQRRPDWNDVKDEPVPAGINLLANSNKIVEQAQARPRLLQPPPSFLSSLLRRFRGGVDRETVHQWADVFHWAGKVRSFPSGAGKASGSGSDGSFPSGAGSPVPLGRTPIRCGGSPRTACGNSKESGR